MDPILPSHIKLIDSLPEERWGEFRELRLDALKNCPVAFQDDLETEIKLPDEVWQERVHSRLHIFAEQANELVGMLGYYRKSGSKVEHVAHIVGVYVKESARGQHIAGMMLERVEQILKQQHVRKIGLCAVASQLAARHVYEQHGFQTVGVRKQQVKVGEKFLDEVIMEKLLE